MPRRAGARNAADKEFRFLPWQAAAAGVILVPISSALGAQAWEFGLLWIWKPSILADVVFALGTVGTHVLATRVGARQPTTTNTWTIAFVVAFALHWLLYTVSWSLVVGPGGADGVFIYGGFGFTMAVGFRGIFAMSFAAVAGAFLHRRPVKAPSRRP